MIRVELDLTQPETHQVSVTLRIPATPQDRTLRLPAWVPGSYKIRDFGRHITNVEATSGGKPLPVEQTGKDAWTIGRSTNKDLVVTYQAYCRELTVDTSHVTADHAHVFHATTVLYDEHTRTLPHLLTTKLPKGWVQFSGMESKKFNGKLEPATDYDHLIDCPLEAGPKNAYEVLTFSVEDKPHRMVLWHADPRSKLDRVTKDTEAIVATTSKIFGGLPYDHYTFIGHVAKGHGGGLEHRNSTVLGIDPLHLVDEEQLETKFYPLVAHEFFHTWNVKRILPEMFQPYDLQQEVYTNLLWLFEGFTTYYELPILHRSGTVTTKSFCKLGAEIHKYYTMAEGRATSPVCQCSRLTWTWLYQPFEENINRNVSYYSKGLFVGLCLDAELRKLGVKDGLDKVMQHLWSAYGQKGIGIPEDGFARIVQDATGKDLKAKIRAWTEGTKELPIGRSLETLGFELKEAYEDEDRTRGLRVYLKDGSTIERIPASSPNRTILQPDDELVAFANWKWDGKAFQNYVRDLEVGATVPLHVFREGQLRQLDAKVAEAHKHKISWKPRKGDAASSRRRTAWIGALRE